MATNWWEIGKPVQDFEPVAQEEKEPNWWEIGTPVSEAEVEQPAEPLVAEATGQPPVEPVPQEQRRVGPRGPVGLGVLDLLTASMFRPEDDPRLGAAARGAELIGSGLEATARLAQLAPETVTTTAPAIGAIRSVAPQLQEWADSFQNWGKEINYEPSTELGDIAENPLQVVPFIIERVIQSSPDMAAAMTALPAYIPALANDILNQRLENDGRTIEQATVGDVAAATAAAAIQGPLERFATRRLGEPSGILGQTALQAGTEAVQEVGQYAAETAGTQVGFDPRAAGLIGLEAAIVGGGLGAAAGTTNVLEQRAIRRDIEDRFRRGEDVRSEEELVELDKLREQAFQNAQSIAAPDLPAATDPLQFGTAYSERIYDSIGQYIPANEEFKVEEKTVDGTPSFVVTDREGTQYGQALLNQAQAESLASGLNNTTQERRKILEQLYPLQRSLSEVMKGFGLNDIGLTLDRRIFTRRGEALTSEGLFDPVTRQVFLAVDAIDPDGTRDFAQRREALRGVLRHEVVHALRYLDLWKKSEWKNLEKTVSKLKKPGTEQTYLDIARTNYGDQSQVIQMEEAVADLIRDVAGNLSRVAGKPRSLSERAINFFDRAKNALTGSGFQTYEDIVRRVESGIVGSRQRGRIRTLRATEEQLGERGITPERIQPFFETPEARNQFRVETAQRMQTEAPVTSQPAINSINLNAVRESRSTIDPVPPKIKVDEQEFPTRDSEGRLIYSGYEGPELFGIQTRPTMEGLQNFWRSFKGSKAVDKQGRPQLYLHGTARNITEFRPKQAGSVFMTRSPSFAEEFAFLSDSYMVGNFTDFLNDQQILETLDEALQSASAFSPKLYDQMVKARDQAALDVQNGRPIRPAALGKFKEVASEGRSSRYLNAIQKRLPSSANLMPVYVNAQKPWDYDNKDDVRAVVKRARENGADVTPSMVEEIQQGNWQTIEGSEGNAPILDAIRELGYDSMFVEEAGQKNLAVFDPRQIKSAIGNNGNFDVTTPSIRESRKEPTYNIINSRTGKVVGQADTINGARRAVDRRDNQYGASVHTIQVVDEEADRVQRERSRARLGLPPLTSSIRESRVRNPQVDTPQFKRWFGDSKAVDESGDPLVMYHGTMKDFEEFKSARENKLFFVSPDPRFASRFAIGDMLFFEPRPEDQTVEWADRAIRNLQAKPFGGESNVPNVMPLYVKAENPFDFSNPDHWKKSEKVIRKKLLDTGDYTNREIKNTIDQAKLGKWAFLEEIHSATNAFRDLGFDSIYVQEADTLNLAVFNPNQLKSAVGNIGEFDITRPSIRESRKFPAKATQQDVAMAQEYLNRTGELPYLSEGQLEPIVPVARQSIKKPYEAKDLAKGKENDPISGLPLNKDGTVTLYFPATNEVARRTIQDKRLRGATPESNRIYLTNESSGPKVMENPGNIDQPMDGANVMIHVDPSLIHFDQEFSDGRKDFFVQLAEGQSYADKMRQTRLFTLDAPRTRALSVDTKLVDIERSVTNSINNYLSLDAKGRRDRLRQAREILKREHNVGTLMSENGKLQKTRIGDYGLTYDGKSVASMGLGLASAQRINEQNLSTCPLSAMCEGLCLGETSGQNLLYGGEGQFKSGPRLSQYLKTEALVQHPEEFAIVLHEEIAKFEKWANSEKGVEQIENEAGEKVMQPKQVYQPAIRLNVTSDFRPQTFASIIEAFPNVMFYDYTKLPTRSIAPNHHLTYSSTGASQVVNGELIVNPGSNWDKMVQRLNEGLNVAMAFTSRKDMPDFILDEKTGQRFQVWDGDNYDARFLDPDREDGVGMVVGLTNKDKTTRPEDAAKKWKGFFLDYDRARDGDTLVIRDQTKLRLGAVPPARESRVTGPASVTIPGPDTDTDTTGAAEALNEGQPVNSLGIPTGPLLTYTMPDGTVVPFEDELDLTPRARESRTQEAIRKAELRPLMKRIVTAVEFFESAPDKLRGGAGLGDIAKRIEDYYDTRRARLGEVNQIIRDTTRRMNGRQLKSSQDTFERYIRARENGRVQDAKDIFNGATENDKKLILAWNEVAGVTGRVNRDVRGPDGEPIKVFDSNLSEWRDIGTIRERIENGVVVEGFFPRSLRREVMEVMMNPKLDPILYDQLLDAVVDSGKAQTRDEAEDFLLRDYFTDEVKNDYFAGVEKARSEALPEIFYDYSWEAATRYLSKWATRTSQIEFFGQELGPFKKDWFDTNIPKIFNTETKEYLHQIRNRIYEVDTFGFWNNAMRWGNVLASGLQLGNPASAFLNLVGGDVANIQMYGWKEVAKAHAELVKDWKKVQEEGTRLGILNTDYLRILQDSERDAGKYFSATDKVGDALSKFTDAALTFSGFNGAENIVRATAMLAARGFLDNSLRAINRNPASAKAKKFTEYVKRENLDLDKLILENGAGPETDRFMRRSVNVAQGSYEIDMTPVFVDTNIGRFLFKYQKFGTQINRFFYRNFLKPFLDEPTDVIKFLRLLAFLLPAFFGGEIINQFRRFLGYGGDYGPTYAQMAKAFEKEETAKAFGLLFSRAMQNATIAGSFGFVGNYYQLGLDIADQQRVKNPMSPPALASVSAIYDLMYRVMDQGQLTARDLDEIAENTMSFYRANKRIALAGMSELGVESKEVDRFVAQRDVREIRRYALRYAQDMELEGTRQRSFSGPPVRTEMTPTNKAIVDALYQGDSARARVLMRDALKGKPYSERRKINQSIRASIRNRQPIQIGGTAPNNQERMDFLRWARKNLSAEEYQKIKTMDRSYRRAAARIGMGFGG